MWFILKQLDMTVPSLASVKAFKLLNMEPPMRVQIHGDKYLKITCFHLFQHATAEGIPFYSISLTSIIRQCLGRLDVSTNLFRYPVCGQNSFT